MNSSKGQNEISAAGWMIIHSPLLIAITSIVALCVSVFSEVLSYWFTGVDTLPLILSNQVDSLLDIPKLFAREHLSAYADEDIAGAVGLRPIGALTFALDYWIWQLNPFGYHLTNLIIHSLNSVLVFLLVRQLKFSNSFFVGMLAAILFAIHPLHARTITVIPVRFDMLLCTFTIVTFIFLLRCLDVWSRTSLAVSLLAGLLALGSKEVAVIILPLAIVTAVVVSADRWTQQTTLLPLAGSFTVVFLGYVVYRSLVLRELGGYPREEQDFFAALLHVSRRFFGLLIYPVEFLDSMPVGRQVMSVIVRGCGAAMLFFVSVGAMHYSSRLRVSWFADLEDRLGPGLRSAFLISCWLVGFFLLYWAVFLWSGILQPWYLYTPAALFSIFVAAVTYHLAAAAWKSLKESRHSFRTVRAAILTLPIFLVALLWIPWSPAFRELDEWSAASQLGRQYLATIRSTVQMLPDGATVFLTNLPHGIECGRPPCLAPTTIFEDYSVDSWVRLVLPEKEHRFVAISTIWLDRDEEAIRSHWFYSPTEDVITVQNTSGCVEPPWRTKSARYVSTEIERAACPRTATIHLKNDMLNKGPYYFFDFFDAAKIFAIGRSGLRRLNDSAGHSWSVRK